MNRHLRTLCSLILLSITLVGVTACNTVKGAGKDVEKAGEEIQEAAERHD